MPGWMQTISRICMTPRLKPSPTTSTTPATSQLAMASCLTKFCTCLSTITAMLKETDDEVKSLELETKVLDDTRTIQALWVCCDQLELEAQ
jgi:hypothetical protein